MCARMGMTRSSERQSNPRKWSPLRPQKWSVCKQTSIVYVLMGLDVEEGLTISSVDYCTSQKAGDKTCCGRALNPL